MKLTYDPHHTVAYIRLQEEDSTVETLSVSDELNVDLSPDGTIYGIELLNANKQLGTYPPRELIVINEETGHSVSLDLAV